MVNPNDAPGPRGWPLAGVAFQFRRDPLALLMNSVRDFGDIVQLPLLRLPLTPLEPKNRLYIVNHPAFVRQICLTKRNKYRTHRQLVDKLKLVLDLADGELLTSVGDEWVQRKTTLQPAFAAMAASSDKIVHSVSGMLERWDRFADGSAPRAQRAEEGPMCVTVRPMRAGPSEPACRSRLQTTFGGCGQKPWS